MAQCQVAEKISIGYIFYKNRNRGLIIAQKLTNLKLNLTT
jgi:hypothetical protein